MIIKTALIVTLVVALTAQTKKPIRFTPDQCRVLNQLRIYTAGLCPPPKIQSKK